MLLRLRSRDGLERVQVPDTGTLEDLWATVGKALDIPLERMALSKDPKLLTSREPEQFVDLAASSQLLSKAGVAHGDMVYLLYDFVRTVEPVYRKTALEARPFGPSMSIDAMISRQTRIERQEAPHCASVSFERHAAHAFQSYVHAALAFSIKRGGILYGSVDGDKSVAVDVIYEPPQSGTAASLQLDRGTEEEGRADHLARLLGLEKVGWIFTQSAGERDYIMDSEEIQQMAGVQDELGETAVSGVVSVASDDGAAEIQFEAFQVSDQAVRLLRDGWFQPQEQPSGESKLRDPKDPKNATPVIVAVKDLGEVDNDYFLIPVGIKDHESRLRSSFPVENRLLPQGPGELRDHLKKFAGRPFWEALSDFHLLLYLAGQPGFDLDTDMGHIVAAINAQTDVGEGYRMIIESIAGM